MTHSFLRLRGFTEQSKASNCQAGDVYKLKNAKENYAFHFGAEGWIYIENDNELLHKEFSEALKKVGSCLELITLRIEDVSTYPRIAGVIVTGPKTTSCDYKDVAAYGIF